MLISGINLNKRFGNKIILEDANFSILDGEKIGFIGLNGEGKSTLLNIIMGYESVDSGEINKRRDLTIGYLSQSTKFYEEATVLEQVFESDSENMRLVRDYNKALSEENIDEKRLLKLTEEMNKTDSWKLEREAKIILSELGISNFNSKIGSLSGGQRRRVALAAALINPVDLLLLDEPTNHLDNETIEWLETYLSERNKALFVITHDRYFLDRVTDKIIELDRNKLYSYEGNYNYFLEKKLEREEMMLASERKRASIFRKELAWMKQGIRARGTRQKSRVQRFEELRDSKVSIQETSLDIPMIGKRLGNKILEVENIKKSYGDRVIINDFSYTFTREDRIGVLGSNGAGKTTLVHMLAGKISPDSGSIEVGETVQIGYFSQEPQNMNPKMRALEYIEEAGEFIKTESGDYVSSSQMMERFLFPKKEQWTPLGELSGGERRRLYLLRVLMSNPNLLILDEPTNDLDIATLQVLEDYLDEFKGPVIIVSHDRYFLDRLINKVFYIHDGIVEEKTGNYYDFRKNLKEKEEKISQAPKETPGKSNNYKNRTLKFSYNEQREWDNIDKVIYDLETKLEKINSDMEKFSTDYSKLEELMLQKEEIDKELSYTLDRWVYLSEIKEEMDNL